MFTANQGTNIDVQKVSVLESRPIELSRSLLWPGEQQLPTDFELENH